MLNVGGSAKEPAHDERKNKMKMLILGAVCAAGLLFTSGCKSCGSCGSGSCTKAAAACNGSCCSDHAKCAKCCTDAAGCAKCCKK